jgi:hypothetical protein
MKKFRGHRLCQVEYMCVATAKGSMDLRMLTVYKLLLLLLRDTLGVLRATRVATGAVRIQLGCQI